MIGLDSSYSSIASYYVSWSALVHVMAYSLYGNMPLEKLNVTFGQLHLNGHFY